MSLPAPAIEDANWLEPEHLYLQTGAKCEIDRPLFQGDVFANVPLARMPKHPPEIGRVTIDFARSIVMVLPHPCQCYNGDSLRPHLTVAPVTEVSSYDNFGTDRSRAYDKFALPDLPVPKNDSIELVSHVASFGRLITVPKAYLDVTQRIACLSHEGLGLLAKRMIRFQLRMPTQLAQAMAFTQSQWNESFLMQAWIRTHKSLSGFSDWLFTEQMIRELDEESPVKPADYVAGALDVLLDVINENSSGTAR